MNKKNYFCFIYFAVAFFSLPAQDLQVHPLTYNPVVAQKWNELKNNPRFRAYSLADTLSLPFFDDFSKETVYPDSSLWTDKGVFINRDFPIAPINIGVATFEGLNREGYPYNFSGNPNSSESADTLTSKPIRMGFPISPADSVYFSFYYQAKGRGDPPDNRTAAPAGNDSLFLQFKKVSTGKWVTVWKKPAYTVTATDTNFHRVMIPVTDTAFFKNGFRFRFRNYATPTGNGDHWHIDYVKLGKNRSYTDTVVNDVNLVYNAQSFIKKYYSMPWRQYTGSNDMADFIRIYIRNDYLGVQQVTYDYNVLDQNLTKLYGYTGGANNLDPYYPSGYSMYINHARPNVKSNIVFPSGMSGNTDFRIDHILKKPNNNIDTLHYYQHFYNYFAYDDGTAEASVFLSPQFAQLGYRFTLNTVDTLRAVRMYFNPFNKSAVALAFRLMIWKETNSSNPGPDVVFYQDSVFYPAYEKGYNNFISFTISNPSLVMPAGTYYFGYTQLQQQDFINSMKIGLDMNTNSGDEIIYNTGGSLWTQANIKGSLMIHPVFGDTMEVSGIHSPGGNKYDQVNVYPVPANDYILIKTENGNEKMTVCFTDMLGRNVYSVLYGNGDAIRISHLETGFYILQLRDMSGKPVFRKKILISR